jgi:hypothetical protein
MIGVSDPYGSINSEELEAQTYDTISDYDTKSIISISFIIAILLLVALVYITQIDPPSKLDDESNLVLDAVLYDQSNDPYEMSTNIAILEDENL